MYVSTLFPNIESYDSTSKFYEKAIFYIDPLYNFRGGRRGPKKFDNFFFTFSSIFIPKAIQIHLGRLTFLKKGF